MLKAYNESDGARTFGTNNHGSLGPNVVVEYDVTIPVSQVCLVPTHMTLNPNETFYMSACVVPSDATNKTIYYISSNTNVVDVGYTSGLICAKGPGTATITARSAADSSKYATCEVWVTGKTPVILIHGRTSNSFDTWGATNGIFTNPLDPSEKDNNHYNSAVNALSNGSGTQALYIAKNVQDLRSYQLGLPIKVNGVVNNNFTVPITFNGEFKKDDGYITTHSEGGNLAYYLDTNGYTPNIDLFAFNYPNEDAVKHSAEKLNAYIANLIQYVRDSGSQIMKCSFYASKADYDLNNYKINLVGHSMGGLISRFYIENLGYDDYVDKLITIDTPHWGSGYANASMFPGLHKICDHDLALTSIMNDPYANDNTPTVGLCLYCPNDYNITPKLANPTNRHTKYYAIAGIDYDAAILDDDNYVFEMPTTYTTYQQIVDFMTSNNVYKLSAVAGIVPMDVKSVGDNMVSFMSQIGWSENSGSSPDKKIIMEKIFIDVDTNGGHGDEILLFEALNMLHGKIQHREIVMQQTYLYLQE